jgi:hypothetical protein
MIYGIPDKSIPDYAIPDFALPGLPAAPESTPSIHAALFSIVGSTLYPVHLPRRAALPAIVYHEIGGMDGMTTDGALGLVDGRFQFTCWAATRAACGTLANGLAGRFGAGVSGCYAGVTIQGTRVVGRGDIQVMGDEIEQTARWGKYIDVMIAYNE